MNVNFTDDADLDFDRINYVETMWEQGARPDAVTAERAFVCGCKAVQVHTAAGWQWVDAPTGKCSLDAHKR